MKNEFCRDYLYHAAKNTYYDESAGYNKYQFEPLIGTTTNDGSKGPTSDAQKMRMQRVKQSELTDKEKRRLYMHNYYLEFRDRWRKGGKYYEAAKRALSKIGEKAYDATHMIPSKAQKKADQLAKQFRAHNEMLIDKREREVGMNSQNWKTTQDANQRLDRAVNRRALYR